MKKILASAFWLLINAALFAADNLGVSGIFDSTLRLGAGAGEEGGPFMYGIEEYANIRLRGKIGDRAVFYGAFNCIAISGMFAAASGISAAADMPEGSISPLSASGGNYVAAIELERLYFHIANEKTGFDAGLMRLAFGYGTAFSPSDFFNPRNPLYPDARPRAILGSLFTFYPDDDSTLRAFAAAPPNPLSVEGGAFRTGVSGEKHFRKFSAQALYTFESPFGAPTGASVVSTGSVPVNAPDGAPSGVHHFGASLKADTFAGLWMDMLYSLNPALGGDYSRELSASAGFDYSPESARLYFLFEYLFNGAYSVTSGVYRNKNYLYGLARYSVSDFTSVSLTALCGFDDGSLTPAASFTTNLFQGFTLTLTAQAPLDRSVFSGGSADGGELGPDQSGLRFLFTVKAEFRF
jgi:hypothetical protein